MSSEIANKGVDYFYRGHILTSVQERISKKARRRLFEKWLKAAKPSASTTVLDVGATPDTERADSNCMIPWIQSVSHDVTLYSVEDISGLSDVFTGIKILPHRGDGIPAADRRYDWVISSAVIEHVGAERSQIDFLRECARVGNGIFLTTPNRMHWLEFHTKLPFIHWLPRRLHRSLLKLLRLSQWAEESHLRLLSKNDLLTLAERALGSEFDLKVDTVWALGMPSNLILLGLRK